MPAKIESMKHQPKFTVVLNETRTATVGALFPLFETVPGKQRPSIG
jgi:hypothetical protein